MKVPFHKPYVTDEEIQGVTDSIGSGWLTMGPKTTEFESNFSEFVGSKNAIAVSSGTAALHLSLKVVDLKEQEEVIIPAMTFCATGEVVCYFNAKPILVDVEKDTHNIELSAIEQAITPKTRAVIPVHYGGQPCDMEEILELARANNLYVIEDAAHAFPVKYKEEFIGTVGDITCFSFYATKPLTTGEGGMVTTKNDRWADRIKILRLHGISSDAWSRHSYEESWYYEVVEAGYKYNMTDIQAALGIAQLKKAEWLLEKRRALAERYGEAFEDLAEIVQPYVKPDRVSSWHLYPIKLNLEALAINRNRFIEEMKARGISTSVHFIPLYRHPFYRNTFGYNPTDFPNCEWIYERVISLPIYPEMTDDEQEYVIDSTIRCCKKWKK